MATTTSRRLSLIVPNESLVLGLLSLTILVSPFVMIEPAPYEACILLFAGALILMGVTVDRMLVPLLLITGIWIVGGAFALMPVTYVAKATSYLATTVYLALSALVFACALSRNTERRLSALLRWYVIAGVLAALLGIMGYFRMFPGAEEYFLLNGRASGAFKDPNVYGPFLVLPTLYLVQQFISRGFKALRFVALLIILLGLFLSFSRGAWGHFVASALTMLTLMFITSRDQGFRIRLVTLSVVAIVGLGLMLALLLSVSSIGAMFAERANLLNYYDAGQQGRFGSQAEGLLRIFDYPNGLGPKRFMAVFGIDPHNVYLASLYAYGWAGGIAYAAMVLATLAVGMRGLWIPAPWQSGLIAIYATFVGVMLEGFIIDTDHWRHYFLLVGGIWGLSIASVRWRDQTSDAPPMSAATI